MSKKMMELIAKLETQLRNFNIAPYASAAPDNARSSVDILTNNELAQTIADLKAAVQAFASRR